MPPTIQCIVKQRRRQTYRPLVKANRSNGFSISDVEQVNNARVVIEFAHSREPNWAYGVDMSDSFPSVGSGAITPSVVQQLTFRRYLERTRHLHDD